VFTGVTLMVFLATAIFFTSVSLNNLRNDILKNLNINVRVLQYSIDSKRSATLSDAQVIAQNPQVIEAIQKDDRKQMADLTTATLLAKQQDVLIIVNQDGAILMRADDPEKIGGSLSDDSLIKKALDNETVSGVVTKEGVIAPTVSVRAAAPIASGDTIIGAVLVGTNIDNAFVDGLKNATGLDASIYGDNIRSATTFIAPDGKSRWVGIKEETERIKKQVLVDGELYSGTVNILNISYLTAISPILDTNNNPVGMLFVGRPEVSTIQSAGELIEQTFLVTVILMIISVFPAFAISKYIISQIK
jgi:methyl-accepting chemotaxis protein